MNKFLVAASILLAHSVLADGVNVWSCSKGTEQNAVTVTKNPQSGEFDLLVQINDAQICNTLNLQCPYQTFAKSSGMGVISMARESWDLPGSGNDGIRN